MVRVRELRDLGDQDLLERLESSKEELFNLRFQLATGQLDNPMRIKQLRHEIAQILTVLRERELEREREAGGTGGSTASEASVVRTPGR
jgi:large subunit ribosomal protein L29